MKKLVLIISLLLIASLVLVGCGDKDKKKAPTNEELIRERIDTFLTAYNDGDMETVLSCFDAKSRNELQALFNVVGSIAGGLTGFNISLSDLFSLGVGMTDEDFMKLDISDITIDGNSAIATGTMDLTGSGIQKIYFYLVFENGGWYINDISEEKKSNSNSVNENTSIDEILDSVDTSFLTNTTVSEGLTYKLSEDKTYYILTGLGECEDTHIVLPEYPVDYNPLPLKEIKASIKNVEYLTVPASVTSFKGYYDGELVAINYLGTLNDWCTSSFTGHPFMNGAVLYLNGKAVTGELVISDSIEQISGSAFYKYNMITSVKIGEKVTSIGEYAFYNCANIKNIAFENANDLTIKDWAFSECNLLNQVSFSDKISSIDSYAFSYCAALERIILGNSINSIGTNAFNNCTSLNSIIIGNSVESIGQNAFSNTAYYNNSSNWKNGFLYIGNYLYSAKEDVINAEIKEGTIGITDYAFYDHDNLTCISIPSSLKWIGNTAFRYCSDLATVKYNGSFENWEQITIGESNTELTNHVILNSETGAPISVQTFEYGGHTYAIFEKKHADTWDKSKIFCESLGGHLATLTTAEENTAIYEYMISVGVEDAFFGLSDAEEEGEWKWVTGEEFDYSNWHGSEPNGGEGENYGGFYSDFGDESWNDSSGSMTGWSSEITSFICEWDKTWE